MKFEKLPQHIAIIPDGNRRWAKTKMLPVFLGHKEGYKRIEELIDEVKDTGIKYLTVWAFSTENWKRGTEEKSQLFNLMALGLDTLRDNVLIKKSRFVHLGRKDRLGKEILDRINALEEATKNYNDFTLCLAIDYGGEDELLRAGDEYKKSETVGVTLYHFLDTAKHGVPQLDLIIRTSGEKRTSGFMPLQSAYSEWYFSEKHFPDFGIKELHEALKDYESRERRLGK